MNTMIKLNDYFLNGKNMYKKTAAVTILILSIWLYVGLTLELTRLIDVPMPVMLIILAILLPAGYLLMMKHEEKGARLSRNQKDDLQRKILFQTFFGTIAGVSLAFIAALTTAAIVDPDYRREFSSYITTCKRDATKIKTLPVNVSTELRGGATLTVHNVTYNVPQDSTKPQEKNNWYCAEATLVEVSLENIPDDESENSLRTSDFALKTQGVNLPTKVSAVTAEGSINSFATYFQKNELSEVRTSFLPQGVTSSRGWLVFAVTENSSNRDVELLITKSNQTLNSISLPDDR